jgi:uncharacterized short protein YbdD (DUF466 family)
MTFLEAVGRGARDFAWLFTAVMGENKYEQYLAHHSVEHPDRPPMSERDFWRDHADRQDSNPQGRCC